MVPVYHKFRSKKVVTDGIKFHSILERNYYLYLKYRVSIGEVIFFLRQTPFHLPAGVKYLADFSVFYSDGSVEFIDVKGFVTATFKLKKRQLEHIYPVELKIVERIPSYPKECQNDLPSEDQDFIPF